MQQKSICNKNIHNKKSTSKDLVKKPCIKDEDDHWYDK